MSDDVPDRGAPEGNDNAVSHGLYQKRDNFREHLSTREEQMLVDISEDLLSRFPEDAHIGAYERMSVRNVAIDVLKRMRAQEYIFQEDKIDDTKGADRINRVYSRIVSDTTDELEKLGLLKEGPAHRSAKADEEASQAWMEAIREAQHGAE